MTGWLLAKGPVICFCLSHCFLFVSLCVLLQRTVSLVFLCRVNLTSHTFPNLKQKFLSHAVWLQMMLLSGCEITICLIEGDKHTHPQLGWAQIIWYTASPSCPFFFPQPLNFSALFLSLTAFSSFSPPLPHLTVEVVIHQTATSVRCQ